MVFNKQEMVEEIVNDLVNGFNYTEGDAIEWCNENFQSIVCYMWDTYTKYIEEFADYKED
jgi:hypothetical protein